MVKKNVLTIGGKLLFDKWLSKLIPLPNFDYVLLKTNDGNFIYDKTGMLYEQDEYIKTKFKK